jgi:hypothetical protein
MEECSRATTSENIIIWRPPEEPPEEEVLYIAIPQRLTEIGRSETNVIRQIAR